MSRSVVFTILFRTAVWVLSEQNCFEFEWFALKTELTAVLKQGLSTTAILKQGLSTTAVFDTYTYVCLGQWHRSFVLRRVLNFVFFFFSRSGSWGVTSRAPRVKEPQKIVGAPPLSQQHAPYGERKGKKPRRINNRKKPHRRQPPSPPLPPPPPPPPP